MANKTQKIIGFFRKNINYFIFLLCLTVVAGVSVALIVNANKNRNSVLNTGSVNQPNNSSGEETPVDEKPNDSAVDSSEDKQPENKEPENKEPDKQTSNVIVFDMPVSGTIIKDYVGASVVYNSTLDKYTGHKAIDFGAEEGASVKASYDGTVKEITESKLTGITVVIDHGNGLLSHYNGVEVKEGLEAGASVKKGDEIGYVSLNNRTEYKDGAHLHFEVTEDGVKVDPNKYLLAEEK